MMKSLANFYKEHKGKVSDKWSLYIDTYEEIFMPYRELPIALLEIGIQNGGSLEIWEKFFPKFEKIIGCDIDPKCALLVYENKNIHVVAGDANSEESKEKILQISNCFEIVIDDGSHFSSDIVKSFFLYFPKIKEGGIFIAEDLHCSYWMQFEGGLYHPHSSLNFFKKLADIVNYEHWGINKSRADFLKSFFSKYDCSIDEETLSQIHSVEFINSICVVKKSSVKKNLLGLRIVAGSQDIVESIINLREKGLPYRIDPNLLQVDNSWSSREFGPDEVIEDIEKDLLEAQANSLSLNQELIQREAAITSLNQELIQRETDIQLVYKSRSWKITRPLRLLNGILEKIKLKIKNKNLFLFHRSLTQAEFNEREYLLCRPDVAEAVARGDFTSGLQHYLMYGINESTSYRLSDYRTWVTLYGGITDEKFNYIQSKLNNMENGPLISIILPTFNANPDWLREAINSVMVQFYKNWELCIADDASTDIRIKEMLDDFKSKDSRIKVAYRKKNGHISAASNSALELAVGDWIAFLDHDDLIAKDALFWIADAICANQNLKLIYSDEDKFDDVGDRFSPYFKTDWNIDLLYCHNMVCHLAAYRANLVKELGGLREGFEGAQDYDLVLRYIEKIEVDQIHHIPRVLYHWRAHDNSTSMSMNAKPYALLAGEKALREHLGRIGVRANVENTKFGYRVNYLLPPNCPLVSLIIPTKNCVEILRECINSILHKTTYKNIEIIVVNNGSDDVACLDYFREIIKNPIIRIIDYPGEFNYSAINNFAVDSANGEIVGLINNDIEVISEDWLSEMVSIAIQPRVGAVGAKLLYSNGTLQHGGVILGVGGVAGHSNKYAPRDDPGYCNRSVLRQSLSAVTAACLVIKKSIFLEVGGLDAENLKIAFNDVDFCLKVRDFGYRNVWTPYAELYHHESISRGAEDSPEKQLRFNREVEYMKNRWGVGLNNDPAYNPNLTLEHEDFSLALPPRINLLAD